MYKLSVNAIGMISRCIKYEIDYEYLNYPCLSNFKIFQNAGLTSFKQHNAKHKIPKSASLCPTLYDIFDIRD